ncbi:MAG: hypothetical protein COC08_04050 [Maribacter sp.]|nr:MAG: hypothetical protein COC08_04050 [Maribacter sp.]
MQTRIKDSTILLLALVVGFLVNLYRFLQLVGFTSLPDKGIAPVTVPDWFMRFLYFSLFSWLVLKFNLVWGDTWFKTSITNRARKIIKPIFLLGISILITITLYFGFYPIYTSIFGVVIPEVERSAALLGWVLILLALLIDSFILKLLLGRKNDAREKEQLKQEKIKSELVALKNQVNPHFLFNSLNTLNSVIRSNPENATDFVDKLAFMYRYILQSSEKGLVPLKEEVEFLNSYVYLINIRYGKRFELKNHLDLDADAIEIPVLSLQLLVENAVKHNEISENSPLKVKIYNDSDYIVVENEIKTRSSLEESTGNGLLNLSKRYQILKKKDIKIYKSLNFTVKLPII